MKKYTLILLLSLFSITTLNAQIADTVTLSNSVVKRSDKTIKSTVIILAPGGDFKVIMLNIGSAVGNINGDLKGTWSFEDEETLILEYKNQTGDTNKKERLLYSKKKAFLLIEKNGKWVKGMKFDVRIKESP